MIVVCPLSRVPEMVRRHGARHVLTLLSHEDDVLTPPGVQPDAHHVVRIHDIVEPLDGCVLCTTEHVEGFLDFVRAWDRSAPLIVHCWAGMSRSTAAAFAAACALAPQRDELDIARALRRASPTATPNGRIVALADAVLGRSGRMLRAADAIGRGIPATEGVPFILEIDGAPANLP